MPTQDELTAIADRLKQGYFLKADMDALGMSGYVSLDDVRAKIKALLTPVQPTAQDLAQSAAQAEAERAQKAQEQLQAEIKAQQDRMAVVDAINAQQEAARQHLAAQRELQETIEKFQAAIKSDPNVKQTP